MSKKNKNQPIIALIVPEEPDPNRHKTGGGNPMKLLTDYSMNGVLKKKDRIMVVDNTTRLKWIKNGIAEDASNK